MPKPRAHKSKYTKYLIFDPAQNATSTSVPYHVFDSQKWQICGTAPLIKELLRSYGRIADVRINVWSD